MNSPFTNYLPTAEEKEFTPQSDTSYESPLLEPTEREGNGNDNFSLENQSDYETGGEDFETGSSDYETGSSNYETGVDYQVSYYAGQEDELSASELTTATSLNLSYMMSLRWASYVDKIVDLLNKKTGINAKASDGKIVYDTIAKAVAKYQELKGLKPSNKGALAIGTWSIIQDDLGFLQYDKPVKINIQKAISANKTYEKELWGSHLSSILYYFSSMGASKDGLPVDAKYFALLVAKYQSLHNHKPVDGILGKDGWSRLKPKLSSVKPPTPATPQTPSRWLQLIPGTVPCPAEPLVHGKETFKRMIAAIKTATNSSHYIYILGWMLDADFALDPDDQSSTLVNLLKNAAANEVEVRVLIWDNPLSIEKIKIASGLINSIPNAVLIKDNKTYGSQGLKNAISKVRSLVSNAPALLERFDSWKNLKEKINIIQNEGSHHEKVLVVKGTDGLIAFCGGIDINRNRVFDPRAHDRIDSRGRSIVLHDVHCEVRGHAAWVLLHRFIWRWKVLKENIFIPHRTFLNPLRGENEPKLPASPSPNSAHVKILQTYNHPTKNIKDRSIRECVKIAIDNARKSVHIEDQYMISLEIATWLNKKLRALPDFKVSILTQDDEIAKEDIQFPKDMRGKFVNHLTAGLTPDQRTKKVFLQMLNPYVPPLAHHSVHSKIYIIDDELAIIGSANCSSRSMTHDSETASVIFNNPGVPDNFVSKLLRKLNYDPETKIIPYKPNPNIKDKDVEIMEQIRKYAPAVRAGSLLLGPAGWAVGNLPAATIALFKALKPAIVDILDPDADNTIPQQEIVEETRASYAAFEGELAGMEENQNSYDEGEQGDIEQNFYGDYESGTEQFADMETTPPSDLESQSHPDEYQLAEVIEQQVAAVKSSTPAKACTGLVCWAKEALNELQGLNLPSNNTIDGATKKAVRDFQVNNNLPVTERIDPVTERALAEAHAIKKHNGTPQESAALNVINTAKTKIEDWTKQAQAVRDKPEITNQYRDPRTLWAFVLHQMAFKRKNSKTGKFSEPISYLKTGAHFCIMFDGKIVQLHPLSRMIWHAQCISPRSVSVEFEGNFPNIKGSWWIDKTSKVQNKDKPTQAQYDSGRFLASYLKIVLGTKQILAHRQSSSSRENDPGPDIWFNVGQWGVDKLGLSDGGPGFKCGNGNPILLQWKTGTVQKEYTEDQETISNDFTYDQETAPDENFTDEQTEEYSFDQEIVMEQPDEETFSAENTSSDLQYEDDPQLSGENTDLEDSGQYESTENFYDNESIHDHESFQDESIEQDFDSSELGLNEIEEEVENVPSIPGARFKRKKTGWACYGGGKLKERLTQMLKANRLSISENEIEIFSLVSKIESGGYVNAINSWDSAYMSMGFIQFTVKFNKLQEVIKLAPAGFRKHGIELDPGKIYIVGRQKSAAIKNASRISELRSVEWATRFYKAGLEDDVIAGQIELAKRVLSVLRERIDKGGYLNRFKNSYPNLWAFIYEAHNSRPAILIDAAKKAIAEASSQNLGDPVSFGRLLIKHLNQSTRTYYERNIQNIPYKNEEGKRQRIKEELDKVGRIVNKTEIIPRTLSV